MIDKAKAVRNNYTVSDPSLKILNVSIYTRWVPQFVSLIRRSCQINVLSLKYKNIASYYININAKLQNTLQHLVYFLETLKVSLKHVRVQIMVVFRKMSMLINSLLTIPPCLHFTSLEAPVMTVISLVLQLCKKYTYLTNQLIRDSPKAFVHVPMKLHLITLDC